MLKSLTENLWVCEAPQTFMGVQVGTRMTVIRLPDASLFVHSPVALSERLKEELSQLGTPRFVIAPNCYHHLYAGDYPKAFPDIDLYLAPGLAQKRRDLQAKEPLVMGNRYPWSDEIDFQICGGMPKVNEVVFLHRPSRTLLLSDLVFNFDAKSSRSARLFAFVNGIYGRLGMGWLDRTLFIRDALAAQKSFARILDWDFDRIIVAHGSLVEKDGYSILKAAIG